MRKIIIMLLLPLSIISQEEAIVGDVDCDGQVTSEDSSLILQYVTSVINSLPCEANMIGLTPEQLQNMIDMLGEQINENTQQVINMIGPMYRYNEYPDFINVLSSETTNSLYYFDAIRFCGQLEYNGYEDWYLPNINQLEEYISNPPGTIEISNIEDLTGNSYSFWLKREPSFSSGYSSNNYIFQYFEMTGNNSNTPYLMTQAGAASAFTELSCFCVR